MSAPFVLITTHRIKPGQFAEFAALAREYIEFVEETEPRLQAHVAYVDASKAEVSLVQVHPDAESVDNHLQVAGSRIGQGLQLADTVAVEVFGEPGPMLREAIAHNVAAGAQVTVKSAHLGGFVRG